MKPEETALATAEAAAATGAAAAGAAAATGAAGAGGAAAGAAAGTGAAFDANDPSTSQGQVEEQQHQRHVSSDGFEKTTCIKRLYRELDEIRNNPPPNCGVESHMGDIFRWRAFVKGPPGTAYEGGTFKLDIRFPKSYPFRPPGVRFATRIYHCNVDSRGAICVDVLNERWSPVMTISMLLLSLWVLIGECNPNDPLVTCIADQYKSNRKEHDKIARAWTLRYAKEEHE